MNTTTTECPDYAELSAEQRIERHVEASRQANRPA